LLASYLFILLLRYFACPSSNALRQFAV